MVNRDLHIAKSLSDKGMYYLIRTYIDVEKEFKFIKGNFYQPKTSESLTKEEKEFIKSYFKNKNG